ncbi:MAG: site-specific integrase [Methylococcaceae bacterium]|nr:site-specific integrase [Methylococcaceae bacterium]
MTKLPPHLGAMVRFTLTTGLRVSNVLLEPEWQQIDMQRRVARIHPDQKAIGVNDDA